MATRLASDATPARRQAQWAPVAVLLVGLLLAVLSGWEVRDAMRARREQRLDALAREARTAVQRQVSSYAETLFGLRNLFAVNPEVSRADFHDAVAQSRILRRFPGARALSFDRALPAAEKDAFAARVRADTSLNGVGYPGFTVHPESPAPDLLVVDFVEPMEGNEAAFGYDTGTDRARRAAAVEARDSGDLVATAPVTLVQGGRGFLLFLAVYDTAELPVTAPARRRHLRGLLAAAFETDKMLEQVLGPDRRLDVDIYDVGLTVDPPQARLLLESRVFGRGQVQHASPKRGTRAAFDLDVGSRRWRVLATPGAELSSGSERYLPWIVLGAGVVLSGLISGLVLSFGRSRRLAIGLATDMTAHLREREQELEDANRLLAQVNDQLAESDRSKTAFLRTISHELETPLTSIRGFSGLLLHDGRLDEREADYASRIARNAEALSKLITELLEFSRLERNQVVLEVGLLSLSELVPRVVDQLAPVLAGHRLRLTVQPRVTVSADSHATTRILTNLLVNAVKFSAPGTEIEVAVAAADRWAELSVADEGPGIPTEDQPQVFDPFFRGSSPKVAQISGMGIGLAVVKELSERMGGSIAVANRESGGSRFTLHLPLSSPKLIS